MIGSKPKIITGAGGQPQIISAIGNPGPLEHMWTVYQSAGNIELIPGAHSAFVTGPVAEFSDLGDVSAFQFNVNSTVTGYGMSFIGNGNPLHSMQWYIDKIGTPDGIIRCEIHLATGTHGTDALPQSFTPLASSDSINSVNAPAVADWVEFLFPTQPVLTTGVTYIAAIYSTSNVDASNTPRAYYDSDGQTNPGYPGNASYRSTDFGGVWKLDPFGGDEAIAFKAFTIQ